MNRLHPPLHYVVNGSVAPPPDRTRGLMSKTDFMANDRTDAAAWCRLIDDETRAR